MASSSELPIAASADANGAYGSAAVALDLQAVLREAAPMPPEPVVVDAFVNGAAAALEKAAIEIPAAKLQNLLQRGPEGYRELTLYLPEKLAQELALHCVEHNLDMSRLVATAIEQILKGAAAAPEPQPTSDVRASSLPTSDNTLSVVARALLLELGEWVRAVWTARRQGLSRPVAPVAPGATT